MSFVDQDTHQGSGPHANQASPHTHYADLTPDQYLITCDLGTDSLHVYDVSEEGKLTLINQYQTAPGAGPRHLVFHPHYKTAYLINELNATIDVLFYDGMGEFEHFQTVSTLPSDYDGQNGLLRSSSQLMENSSMHLTVLTIPSLSSKSWLMVA